MDVVKGMTGGSFGGGGRRTVGAVGAVLAVFHVGGVVVVFVASGVHCGGYCCVLVWAVCV